MPPKPPTADAWQGAPPATADAFAFAHGDFFASASNQNRHRRATPAELKEHFKTGSDRDHPAHWFEAQLLHYGLAPSKTKSVARMRLFDAVNAGKLAVPPHISKLEGSLKKEWTKRDREAKKAVDAVAKAGAPTVAGAKKRKAESTPGVTNVTVNVTISGSDSPKPRAVKKAKTAEPKAKPAPKAKTAAPKAAPKAKATPKPASATPAKKPTARARRGGLSQGPSRDAPAAAVSPPPRTRTKQTARRGAPFMARGRVSSPPPQPSYDGYDGHYGDNDDDDDNQSQSYGESPPPYYDDDDDDADTYGDVSLAPLGLLNGSYDITCPDVASEWSHYGSDFDLSLTLAGTSVWGKFELGVIQGIMYFRKRPWRSSHEPIPFKWRGTEDQGPVMYGDRNDGWVRFLGDGRIEGSFDYQSITFRGRHCPGQGSGSGANVRDLQDEWGGYSEEEYDRQRRARWS
ncbi:hypothetical protein QQX98_009804 [Neonectria punicea]|uniref:Uncharacterized protein n=1 Tax=Neonectria punicea TaxID=979145 RepID=A0ABR1GR84_9HYPO